MTTDDRRQLILNAAERLVAHYGPAKTTVGDIAREVGIGVGSVYLEFPSKEAIVAELSADRQRRIVAAMRSASAKGDYPTRFVCALEARVRILFELASSGAHECDLVACGAVVRGADRRSVPGAFRDEERQLLRALLVEGMARRQVAQEDPDTILAAVELAYAALSPPWLFSHTAETALAAARRLNQLLMRGLASTSNSPAAPPPGRASANPSRRR